MEKSNLDVAYEIMLKTAEPMSFANLWSAICEIQNFDEAESKRRMGKFYTNLFMDGRFITLGDNVWDLRDRYTFDRVHIDMNDVYHDDDDETEIIVDADNDEIVNDEENDEMDYEED